MSIGLRSGVSFCEASGHLVFLDLHVDRYFGLVGAAEAAFRRLVRGGGRSVRCTPIEEMIACGLLVDGPDVRLPAPCTAPPTPRTTLLDRRLPSVPPTAIALAALGIMRARVQLRRAGLAAALGAASARKTRVPERTATPDAIGSSAATFRQCSLFTRSHDQCLVRSLALVCWLADRGEAAELVVGVRVRPFSAHAWVQKDDLLLNERCDGVRAYTPILVI